MQKLLNETRRYIRGFFALCIKNDRLIYPLALALFSTAYALLCVKYIGSNSIWLDEGFTRYMVAQNNPLKIFYYTCFDVHPPLYYEVLWLWSRPFGASIMSLRLFSTLFGVLTIVVSSVFLRRIFGKTAGYAAIFAISAFPLLIRYGSEMRMYTLGIFIALLATIYFAKALCQEKLDNYSDSPNSKKCWKNYTIVAVLCAWTHYFLLLVVLSHIAYRLYSIHAKPYFLRHSPNKSKNVFKNSVNSKPFKKYMKYATIFSAFPILAMIIQGAVITAKGFWIGEVSTDTINNALKQVLMYSSGIQNVSWSALVYYVLIVLSIWTVSSALRANQTSSTSISSPTTGTSPTTFSSETLRLFVWSSAIPVCAILIASLPPLNPMFNIRYILPSALFFILALCIVSAKKFLPSKIMYCFLAISLIIGNINLHNAGNGFDQYTPSTKQLVEKVNSVSEKGETYIAASGYYYYSLSAYDSASHPVYFMQDTLQLPLTTERMLRDTNIGKITNNAEFFSKGKTFWLFGDNLNDAQNPPTSVKVKALKTVDMKSENKSDLAAVKYIVE
jgi:4-amino-4-deoxy-L-arabinose transferase-like glycosyltransferase